MLILITIQANIVLNWHVETEPKTPAGFSVAADKILRIYTRRYCCLELIDVCDALNQYVSVGNFLRGQPDDDDDDDDDNDDHDDGTSTSPDATGSAAAAPFRGRAGMSLKTSVGGVESTASTIAHVSAALHLRSDGVAVTLQHARAWCVSSGCVDVCVCVC